MKESDSCLILSDSWGIYIPQMWARNVAEADCAAMGIDPADVAVLGLGPDGEDYWEAWAAILDSAEWPDSNGRRWRLHQDGDLWEVATDAEWPGGF